MKRFAVIIILIIAVFVMCGCEQPSYSDKEISSNHGVGDDNSSSVSSRVLYVSGAVQNDGYVTLPQICDYKTVLDAVGIIDESLVSYNLATIISDNLTELVVDFVCDGVNYSSVNVNGEFVKMRLPIDGVAPSVVDRLADYIELNGKITNREQLQLALDDDYSDNYYKFFIDIDDYA